MSLGWGASEGLARGMAGRGAWLCLVLTYSVGCRPSQRLFSHLAGTTLIPSWWPPQAGNPTDAIHTLLCSPPTLWGHLH